MTVTNWTRGGKRALRKQRSRDHTTCRQGDAPLICRGTWYGLRWLGWCVASCVLYIQRSPSLSYSCRQTALVRQAPPGHRPSLVVSRGPVRRCVRTSDSCTR